MHINSLPPEILKEILDLATFGYEKRTWADITRYAKVYLKINGRHAVLELSGVCRLWRQVMNEYSTIWHHFNWNSALREDVCGFKAAKCFDLFSKEVGRFSRGIKGLHVDFSDHWKPNCRMIIDGEASLWPMVRKACIYYHENSHLIEKAEKYGREQDLSIPGATLLPQLVPPFESLMGSMTYHVRYYWRQFLRTPDFGVIAQNLRCIELNVGKGSMDMTAIFNLQHLEDLKLIDLLSLTITVDEPSIKYMVPKLKLLELAAKKELIVHYDANWEYVESEERVDQIPFTKLLWRLSNRENAPLRLEKLILNVYGFWDSKDSVGVFTKWMNKYGIPRLTKLGLPLSLKAKVGVITKALRECPKLKLLNLYMEETNLYEDLIEPSPKRVETRPFERLFAPFLPAIQKSSLETVILRLVSEPEHDYDISFEFGRPSFHSSNMEDNYDDIWHKLNVQFAEIPGFILKWFDDLCKEWMKSKDGLEAFAEGHLAVDEDEDIRDNAEYTIATSYESFE